MRVYRSALSSDGYVAGGIRAKWWRKEFWSYTVWETRESMENFVRTEPHFGAMLQINRFADSKACYVEWESDTEASWPEALERLKKPTDRMVNPSNDELR